MQGVVTISNQVKRRGRIWKCFFYPFLVLLSALFVYISVADSMVDEHGAPVRLFGWQIAPVHTDTMAPAVSSGDAVVIRDTDPEEIRAGEIIVYRRSDAQLNLNRVVSRNTILNVLYLTVQNGNQSESVPADHVYGTVTHYIPCAGYLLDFLDTPAGTVVCIGGPVLLIILLEIFSSVRRAKRSIRSAQEKAEPEEAEPDDDALEELARFGIGAREEPVYHAGSFSPQYAYHPPQPSEGEKAFFLKDAPEGDGSREIFSSSFIRPEPEPILLHQEEASPAEPEDGKDHEGENASSSPAFTRTPDQKLSLTLSGDESSEFTVNGINIRYEDDTLNLSLEPEGDGLRIQVRMRDDEAKLMFKSQDKTTRFAIVNREGKPRRISISGREEPEDFS